MQSILVSASCKSCLLSGAEWYLGIYLGGAKMEVRASLVSQMLNNLPTMQETWVQSLGWEDPLEESMTTHSSIIAWRIPMDREAWWAMVYGVTKSRTPLTD